MHLHPIWQDLFINFALASLFISIWRHFRQSVTGANLVVRRIVFGLLMGAAAICTMFLSFQVSEGVFFDLRNGVIILAGGFGGPIATLIAGTIAGAYRLAIGGTGAWPGLIGIALSAVVGLLINFSRIGRPTTNWHVVAMAFGASAVFFASSTTLPFGWGSEQFVPIALPVGSMLLVTTFVLGAFLLSSQRSSRERDLHMAAALHAPDFRYIKDTHSRFVTANLATVRVNGLNSVAEIVGKTDFDLEDADRAQNLFDAEQKMMKTGVPLLNMEEKVEMSDGSRWFSSSKVPLSNQDGKIIGMAGFSADITDKKELEISLGQAKNRLYFALSEMSDGLAMFDRNDRLLFCNERYHAMFPLTAHVRKPGVTLTEILREVIRTGEQVNSSSDDPEFWIDTVIDNLRQNTEEQAQMYDGRWLSIRTRPAKGGNSMVLVTDITQSKLAEMELIRSAQRLKALAETDGLTGLSNRRAFDSALRVGMQKAQESNSHLSLLLLDIDHFKSYNDTKGHAAGDECLRQVAQYLQSCVTRSVDVVARYGGEEFALILIGTDIEGASAVAKKIHEGLNLADIPHEASPFGRITVSVGVSTLLHAGSDDTPDAIIRRADRALYEAKGAGRNQTHTWKEEAAAELGLRPTVVVNQ